MLTADLTGVPDFFSQMSAFARSVLPIKAMSDGRKLPALKWWAKGVFAIYMLVTLPLLGLLLLLMLKSVPRVLGTVWDSAGRQTSSLLNAAAGGDMLGALSDAQLLEPVKFPFGDRTVTRFTFWLGPLYQVRNHHGQLVVYLRMNGIVPPTTARRPA